MTSVITEATDEDLLTQAHSLKKAANGLFVTSNYEGALTGYEKALEVLPNTYEYEIAVVRSNMAACLLKMGEWKRAEEEVGKGLDELDAWWKKKTGKDEKSEDVSGADDEEDADAKRMRMKLLLRRGKARMEIGSWQSLQGAQEDYQALEKVEGLSSLDKKTVKSGLLTIGPKLEEAKQAEMGDMMGKLKELGNGILKPFGLSTNNFNMIKDEKTGGYNMSFS
jgi:tetratricopeptide (TPR) repeat protein